MSDKLQSEGKPQNFFQRNWKVLVLFLVGIAIIIVPGPFEIIGTIAYIVVLPSGAMLMTTILRALFFTQTSDHDAKSGRFVQEWNAQTSKTRVILTVVQFLVIFLAVAIIAAALIN